MAEKVLFEDPEFGVVVTTRVVALAGQSIPIRLIREVTMTSLPGNSGALPWRFVGWLAMIGGCGGCIAAPGFAGFGMLVVGALVQLAAEIAFRSAGGHAQPAAAIQLDDWSTVTLPLPRKWIVHDFNGFQSAVRQRVARLKARAESAARELPPATDESE